MVGEGFLRNMSMNAAAPLLRRAPPAAVRVFRRRRQRGVGVYRSQRDIGAAPWRSIHVGRRAVLIGREKRELSIVDRLRFHRQTMPPPMFIVDCTEALL